MVPRIKSGQLVTVTPTPHDEIEAGDIVLCKVSGAEYLHLVVAVLSRGRRDEGEQLVFVIGNNRGRINGRTSNVYGKVTRIE